MALLWKPLSFGDYDVQTTLRQADVKMRCDLTNFIQRQIFFSGAYEESYCEHWIRLSRDATVVFDIGANVGVYALLAAAVNSEANIHAFEPTPEMAARLEENIKLNDLPNITVLPFGVGSSSRTAFLRICRGSDNSNEGMNFVVAAGVASGVGDQAIKIVSLDDYCRQMDIKHIDLLKIDIEGGEYDALLGARELLTSRSIGCLFIEFAQWAASRSGHSTLELIALLQSFDYKMFRLVSGRFVDIDPSSPPDGENIIAVRSGTEAALLGGRVSSEDQRIRQNLSGASMREPSSH